MKKLTKMEVNERLLAAMEELKRLASSATGIAQIYSEGICHAVSDLALEVVVEGMNAEVGVEEFGYYDARASVQGVQLDKRWKAFRKKAFKSWPHFSGNVTYPVPSPTPALTQKEARKLANIEYTSTINLWQGAYGKKRKALLNHLIKSMKEEIKNGKA